MKISLLAVLLLATASAQARLGETKPCYGVSSYGVARLNATAAAGRGLPTPFSIPVIF
jgi:hypothetical protein